VHVTENSKYYFRAENLTLWTARRALLQCIIHVCVLIFASCAYCMRHTCYLYLDLCIIVHYSNILANIRKQNEKHCCTNLQSLYCHQYYSLIKLEFIGQTFVKRSNQQAESELVLICAYYQCLVYQKFLSYHSYHIMIETIYIFLTSF